MRLLSLLLLLVTILGNLAAPEVALAEFQVPADHGMEILSAHYHADEALDGHTQDQNNAPCHATVHHHCSVSIVAGEASLALPFDERRTTIRPPDAMPMSSLAHAPPTQPPSA